MSVRWWARTSAVVGLAGAGVYFFVYLYRWEWNRALVAGLVFVAAELGLSLMVVVERLRRIEARLDDELRRPGRDQAQIPDSRVLEHLRTTGPEGRDPFRWLRADQGHSAVFVPILLGAGVVASALAWVVERIATRTARPAMERALAARLSSIAWPSDPLAPSRAPAQGWLAGPGHETVR